MDFNSQIKKPHLKMIPIKDKYFYRTLIVLCTINHSFAEAKWFQSLLSNTNNSTLIIYAR